MKRTKLHKQRKSAQYWALAAFFILTCFMGGAARDNVASLILLRPVAVLFCAYGLWTMTWDHVLEYKGLFGFAGAIFLLIAIHLIPLPPAIWQALPGREIVVEVDKVAGLGEVWRPIAMVPMAAWNALYSLVVPLAILLLGVQLTTEERYQLLPLMLAMGLLSGFWGMLQLISSPTGPLYLYDITNNGDAVGLFANRNHQAIWLAMLFPMLGVYAATLTDAGHRNLYRQWAAIAAAIILIPLILVTGSRAGLILGVLGLLLVPILYSRIKVAPKKNAKPASKLPLVIGGAGVLGLGMLSVFVSRAEAIQRLLTTSGGDETRFVTWPSVVDVAWHYFPMGSGVGSLVEVYQQREPNLLLDAYYLNHAHNDWLELFMTMGMPGLLILGAALIAFGVRLTTIIRKLPIGGRAKAYGLLGAVVIAFCAFGSIGDYPLRVPILSCVFVIALLWFNGNKNRNAVKADEL